ncbi:hypothetical protein SAMN05421761_10614 [Belliella pelovolcani]|uniref:Uncharacterized protein n=1 Tax=Belliella pelovolcani TaxID=529505 RepID=A0A1N7MEN6_9BACT|nr:hypothetical protein SAMN05421761_10614 [Belliella pelovolcani]
MSFKFSSSIFKNIIKNKSSFFFPLERNFRIEGGFEFKGNVKKSNKEIW